LFEEAVSIQQSAVSQRGRRKGEEISRQAAEAQSGQRTAVSCTRSRPLGSPYRPPPALRLVDPVDSAFSCQPAGDEKSWGEQLSVAGSVTSQALTS